MKIFGSLFPFWILVPFVSFPGARAQEQPLPFVAPLFSDNMVLQRDQADAVWGCTKPGETVTVTMGTQTATAVANDDGKWMVRLTPPAAGGPYELKIAGSQEVTFHNVLVGDVWICSGQSNMAFGMQMTDNAAQEIANANQPSLRLFLVGNRLALSPVASMVGAWQPCTPDTIKVGGWMGFSAVGYFFGRDLQQDIKVPVGLIETAWGGTPAESWTSRETLTQKVPDFDATLDQIGQVDTMIKAGTYDHQKLLDDWYAENQIGSDQSAPDFDASAWKTMAIPKMWQQAGDPAVARFLGLVWFRKDVTLPPEAEGKPADLLLGGVSDLDVTWVNGVQVGTQIGGGPRHYKIPAGVLKAGRNVIAVRAFAWAGPGGLTGTAPWSLNAADAPPISLAGDWQYQPGIALDKTTPRLFLVANNPDLPTEIFNAMVSPLMPFGIKGAIWYQGEANVGRAYQYRTLLPAMIGDWRQRWGQGDFPFLLVQLANLGPDLPQPGESDWAELREAQDMTAKAGPDIGIMTAVDIGNPVNIHPTNKQEVGRRLSVVARAQVYHEDVAFSGPAYQSMKVDGVSLRITFAHDEGMKSRDGGALKGFAVAGADHRFYWADAQIDGRDIVLTSSSVPTPVAARYDWASNPQGNLINAAGLPAFPFRTDDWPGVTVNDK